MDDIRVIELNLNDLCQFEPLSKKKEVSLFRRLAQSKLPASKKKIRDEIIKHNGRLVVSVTSTYYYSNCNIPFHELVQDGVLGLITAIGKFDYKRGYKFSTYATPWIRQAVSRSIAENSRTVRLPVYKSDLYIKISRIKQDRPDITNDELAMELGISVAALQDIIIHGPGTISLDAILGGDDNVNSGYSISASSSVTDYDDTRVKLLATIEEKCTAREARILEMRYGLSDGVEMTLKEIGERFNLTRERIRQLEARALKKLSVRKELRELL